MSVGEEYSAFRQSVNIRRLYTRVAAEAADPVVHVVDRYEQNVRPLLLTIRKRRERAGDKFPSSDHRFRGGIIDLSGQRPEPRVVRIVRAAERLPHSISATSILRRFQNAFPNRPQRRVCNPPYGPYPAPVPTASHTRLALLAAQDRLTCIAQPPAQFEIGRVFSETARRNNSSHGGTVCEPSTAPRGVIHSHFFRLRRERVVGSAVHRIGRLGPSRWHPEVGTTCPCTEPPRRRNPSSTIDPQAAGRYRARPPHEAAGKGPNRLSLFASQYWTPSWSRTPSAAAAIGHWENSAPRRRNRRLIHCLRRGFLDGPVRSSAPGLPGIAAIEVRSFAKRSEQ